MRIRFIVGSLLLWATSAAAQVSGTVVDDSSGTPIEGARVTLRATDVWTETDASGRFDLGVPDGGGCWPSCGSPAADAGDVDQA